MWAYRSLRVVETGDNGGAKDGNTGTDRLARVVEKRLEVGVGRETESSHALVSTVDDEEGTIGKSYNETLLTMTHRWKLQRNLPDCRKKGYLVRPPTREVNFTYHATHDALGRLETTV